MKGSLPLSLQKHKNYDLKNPFLHYEGTVGSCPHYFFNYIKMWGKVSPIGGDWGCIPPPTSQNFDKSPLTKILSLPINVPLHLVWHPFPSISQSPLL